MALCFPKHADPLAILEDVFLSLQIFHSLTMLSGSSLLCIYVAMDVMICLFMLLFVYDSYGLCSILIWNYCRLLAMNISNSLLFINGCLNLLDFRYI